MVHFFNKLYLNQLQISLNELIKLLTCSKSVTSSTEFNCINGAFGPVERVTGTAFHQVENFECSFLRGGNQVVSRWMERETVNKSVVNFVKLKNFAHPGFVDFDDSICQSGTDTGSARVKLYIVCLCLRNKFNLTVKI